MNQGVEILLARMDSNPDEFVGMDWPRQSKWSWVMDDLRKRVAPDADAREAKKDGYIPLRFLTDIEVQALWDKLESLRADQFTKKVMETLLREEEEEEPDLMRYSAADMAREFGAKVDTMLLDEWAKAKGVGK